jgi:glutathione S-transferase
VRKLYYSDGSPYARKVRIVLAEKGVSYEHDRYDNVRPVEVIRTINPNLVIPIFEDVDLRLFDSKVIVEYALETFEPASKTSDDPPLYGAVTRPEYHWEDRKTLTTLETLTETIVNVRMLSLSGVDTANIAYLKRQVARIGTILDWIDTRATVDGFFPGYFSVLDIELICAVDYAETRAIADWRGRPNIDRLVERFCNRASVRSTYPGRPSP